jgi:hypothetical protein
MPAMFLWLIKKFLILAFRLANSFWKCSSVNFAFVGEIPSLPVSLCLVNSFPGMRWM